MHEKIYRGGITCEQFLFHEMRITARLYSENKDFNWILEKVKNENLFQFPTERTIGRITKACVRRLECLDSEKLVLYLFEESAVLAKQVNLYALMLDNAIVWDFMTQVIGEKFRTQDFSYSKKDLNIFMFELQESGVLERDWSDSTVKKIKGILNKILVDCDYLDNTKSEQLNSVYLYPELEEELRSKHDAELLAAFNAF